jgi:hypothetical protein
MCREGHVDGKLTTQYTNEHFLLLERPNLFAICNNTFSKWWEGWRMACRRVLSSTPLLVRGSETGGDSGYAATWEVVHLVWELSNCMELRPSWPASSTAATTVSGSLSCSGSSPEIRECSHRDLSRWPRGTLYPQKLALTSPTSSGRLVDIVCLRTQATEFSILFLAPNCTHEAEWTPFQT